MVAANVTKTATAGIRGTANASYTAETTATDKHYSKPQQQSRARTLPNAAATRAQSTTQFVTPTA